ncbi:hypothetical protein NHG32_06270 [Aerococcaceae bacterium NML191219]|nr:hypothetical protein [Aerococcaceae bacterium NML191219]
MEAVENKSVSTKDELVVQLLSISQLTKRIAMKLAGNSLTTKKGEPNGKSKRSCYHYQKYR